MSIDTRAIETHSSDSRRFRAEPRVLREVADFIGGAVRASSTARASTRRRRSGRARPETSCFATRWTKLLEWKAPFSKWFLGRDAERHRRAASIDTSARRAKRRVRSSGRASPVRRKTLTLRRAPRRGREARRRAARARPQQGRPRRDLHGHGARGRRRRCSPARASAPRTPSYSVASPQNRCAIASTTARRKVVLTQDGGFRRGRVVPLKATVDRAVDQHAQRARRCWCCSTSAHEHAKITLKPGRDVDWADAVAAADPEQGDARRSSTPSTRCSSSTPRARRASRRACCTRPPATSPVRIVTSKYVFDLRDDDVYFCTADVGWVTGHSYIVYGPLSNGATCVLYEGAPNSPTGDASGRSSRSTR